MVYDIALYAALALLGIGLVHRIDAWFLASVGVGDRSIPFHARLAAGLKACARSALGAKIVRILRVAIVDILFQGRILADRQDPLAWIMHFCIFAGFLLLLLFHALGLYFGRLIGPSYAATLNPFLFLRNLSGAVLVVGVALAIVRRRVYKARVRTTAADVAALAILLVIALSGFLLEGLKITSEGEFARMAREYAGLDRVQAGPLRAYWAEEFGLVAPAVPHDAATVADGRQMHQTACASCHSAPQAAFVSYPLSRAIAPVAPSLDRASAVRGLWWVHVICCCVGLAYLAFGKMFHMVGTPVSLVIAEVSGPGEAPAAAMTRQVIELDGCSHGGACHDGCPVRQRRLERIAGSATYEPMLRYLGEKKAGDLGSRPVSG